MPFSGGSYTAPSNSFNPAVTLTTISSSDWATLLSDLSSALSSCVLKDGTQIITASIPMASNKFTGLAAGTSNGDSVRFEQVLLLTGGTLAGDLLFTDATFDIGKSGATRPRDGFFSRNFVVGGTLNVTGHVTLEGVTSTGAQGSGALVFATSPTLTTAVLGSSTATTQGASDNSTKVSTTAYVDRKIKRGTVCEINPIATNSQQITAHGLGGVPDWCVVDLVCLTGELGYSAGDVAQISENAGVTATTDGVITPLRGATNITLTFSNNSLPTIARLDTKAEAIITAANWKLRATPYLVS